MNAPSVHWDILKQDLRYTARTLMRSRGFALTAILVTALGVGANTAAFSVADFVLLRPLQFPDSDRLVRLCEGPRQGGGWGCMNQLSPANYRDFKRMSSSFEEMGAFTGDSVNLVGGGEPRRLAVTRVTPEVLPLLGVRPVIGRVLESDSDDDRGSAVISYGLWQSQFGGDPGVLGQKVNLNGAPFTIIGVMPPAFYFPGRDIQMWTLLTFTDEDLADRTNSYIEGVGRLQKGVTFEQARAELTTLAERLGRDYPDTNAETGISFYRMRDAMAPRYRVMLMALSGASICLLLLTCASLASLLLARATARGREFAVRAALGAGRERLVRQLITESVVLSLLGGAVGVGVAALGVPLFSSLIPPTMPLQALPALDLRVLAMAAVFAALTGVGFGLVPALRTGGRRGFSALREGSRSGGGAKQRLRAALVTVEITMSVMLLITSGLLIRAVWRVQSTDPGFATHDVVALRTALPRPKYDDPGQRGVFYDQVLRDVRGLPGVQSAAYITGLPMAMPGGIARIQFPGRDVIRDGTNTVSQRWVTPQFFATLSIPILKGRDVEDADTTYRAWVAVVSESFGARFWPGQDPIGRIFLHGDRPRTIVGVVRDIRVRGLERTSEPQIYVPVRQAPVPSAPVYDAKDLVIHHSGQAASIVTAVRSIVRAADPDQPISDVRTLEDVVAGETETRRAQLRILGTLAAIALLLAAVGIHGLLAYTVAQRSQEIGVRLALGAEPWGVARMILSDGMRLALVGIALGVPGAYAAARGMSALLFGIPPGDPLTLTSGTVVVVLVTLVGALAPALAAVRVSPLLAMRAD